jgi:hypothetical protein
MAVTNGKPLLITKNIVLENKTPTFFLIKWTKQDYFHANFYQFHYTRLVTNKLNAEKCLDPLSGWRQESTLYGEKKGRRIPTTI